MSGQPIHAVTGAFGFSGKYIAGRLLEKGYKVVALTHSLRRENPFGNRIAACAFNFDRPDRLIESLEGVSVLYNTYWVRFNHKKFTFARALNNVITMFEAAKKAGVERIVHISITNPSEDSHLEYFSGKAKMENALQNSGLSYAILRPAVLFGSEDILINNIAWALRKFPVFGVFGDGQYRLQPIYVDDLAGLAVAYGETRENAIIDAIGPETFTFRELVRVVGEIIGKPRLIVSLPPRIGYLAAAIIGKFVNNVLLTRDEIEGLMSNLLYVDSPPAGNTKLTDWVKKHSETVGLSYQSELKRRLDRKSMYKSY